MRTLFSLIAGNKLRLIVIGIILSSLTGLYFQWKAKITQEAYNKIQQESIEALNDQYQKINTVNIAYEANNDAIRNAGRSARERLGEISEDNESVRDYLDSPIPPLVLDLLRESTK